MYSEQSKVEVTCQDKLTKTVKKYHRVFLRKECTKKDDVNTRKEEYPNTAVMLPRVYCCIHIVSMTD